MRYGELTYEEIAAYATAGAVAVVPAGCTEQQGPHLPVDVDSWFAESLMVAAAERAAASGVQALVLPVLPFGPTPEHRGYGSGFIDLPRHLHETVVGALLDSLADQGFTRLMLWQGCGGHQLAATVQEFNRRRRDSCRAVLPAPPFFDLWCRIGDPAVPGGHADSFITSIVLYKRPYAVRHDRLWDPGSRVPDWDDPDLDFTRYSSTGVIGDPTQADAALGEALWNACVDWSAEALVELAALPL